MTYVDKLRRARTSNTWINLMEYAISDNQIRYHPYQEFTNIQEIDVDIYGKAYLANNKNSNCYILKSFFNISSVTVEETIKEFKLHYEIEYHENILRFHGITKSNSTSENDRYLLVLDYADGGSLQSYLKNNFHTLTWNDKFNLSCDLSKAVLYLHSKGIWHRDLNSKNMFVHQNTLKLGDFGLIKRIDERSNVSSKVYGLIPYIDPKVFDNRRSGIDRYQLNEKSDVYSVGVLLWEISSGFPPFYNEDRCYDFNLAIKITKGLREKVVVNTPVEFAKLYTECWNGVSEKRPNARQIAERLNTMMSRVSQTNHVVVGSLTVPQNEPEISSSSNHSLSDNNLKVIVDGTINLLIQIINEGKNFDEKKLIIEDYITNENNTTLRTFFYWLFNNQDYSNSIFLLGYFNLCGIETSQNNERAFQLFVKASKKDDNVLAHYYVGECYQYGYGIKKNPLVALECYQYVSSAKNFGPGQSTIGYFYQSGIGVEVNERMAVCYYNKASNNGNLIAVYNLGLCFIYGSGVVKDDKIAFDYFKRSADGGYLHGISMLAHCYNRGIGTKVNKPKSFEYYLKASNLENGLAQFNLAEMYMRGDGIAVNKDQAIYWYKKSAKNGYDKAQDILNEIQSISPEKDLNKVVDGMISIINKIADVQNKTEERKQEVLNYFSNYDIILQELIERLSNNQNTVNNIFLLGYLYYIKISNNNKGAFKLFHTAAEQNYALGQFYVGKCYQYGHEIAKDDKLAFKYYHKSANNECAVGQFKIAFYYQNGIFIEKNKKLAFHWYKKAASLGNTIAVYNVGLCYYNRNGVRKDYDKAFESFKQSANDENVDGIGMLGYCYQMGIGTNVDKNKAFELYKKASYLGKDLAQYNLGNMYENGDGITKDMNKAIHWYKICAKSGFQLAIDKLKVLNEFENLIGIADEIVNHYIKTGLNHDEKLEEKEKKILGCLSKSGLNLDKFIEWLSNNQNNLNNIFLLGYLHYVGVGTNKNYDQAFKLLNLSARNNHVLGQYFVGLCYQFGNGTMKSDKLAFDYYQKVADRDFPAGQVKVGYFYENGIGTEKNETIAVHWYRKSADNENVIAIYNLGYCYLHGIGIQKDEIEAFELFKRSAEKGYIFGIVMLGHFYQNGIATNVDMNRAFGFYQKAANLGNVIAQYNLAEMCLGGGDIDQARFWFENAARNGSREAQRRLEGLLEYRR